MPYCEPCARHWTPTSMRPDGSCPACGRALELRTPLPRPAGDDPAGNEESQPRAPWHFKVMLLALVIYLAWRGVQGVEWIARHL